MTGPLRPCRRCSVPTPMLWRRIVRGGQQEWAWVDATCGPCLEGPTPVEVAPELARKANAYPTRVDLGALASGVDVAAVERRLLRTAWALHDAPGFGVWEARESAAILVELHRLRALLATPSSAADTDTHAQLRLVEEG